MIKINKLLKVYISDEVETTAVNEIDLQINQGEFLAIMGPSGCGKSSLLNILGLLDSPSGGEYWFGDEDVSSYTERERAGLRKEILVLFFKASTL